VLIVRGGEGIGRDIATLRTAADIAIPIVAAIEVASARANSTWTGGRYDLVGCS
jgi:hypothetical protein